MIETGRSDIRRIVLLGHSGFIGTHLYKVFGRRFPGAELVGLSFPEFDLTLQNSVADLKLFFGPHTAVVMCSAIKRQFGDDLDTYQKNIEMCLNVARAIEASSIARLVFFSSMAVYGEDIHNLAIDEFTPICPRSYYGLAKYTGELIFERVFSRQEGSFVAIRPPAIYGPGDESNTYGPAGFLKSAIEKRPITLWGDGEELREFIFIDDISEIVTRLLTGTQKGIVNIAAGNSYSFRDILNILEQSFPQGIQVVSRPRSKEKVDNVSCNKKIQEWLGGFHFTTLEDGVRKMVEFESRHSKA